MKKTKLEKFSNASTSNSDNNIRKIKEMIEDSKFDDVKELKSPTDELFLGTLKKTIKNLRDGDFVFIYFFGHGGQIKDDPRGYDRESDNLDETFVTYNREVRDDEIHKILKSNKSKAQILFIMDACNSESSITFLGVVDHLKSIDDSKEISLDLIYMGATNDGDQIPANSYSKLLEEVWDDGYFNGNYRDFQNQLIKKSKKVKGLSPILNLSNASSEFINQKPFKQ